MELMLYFKSRKATLFSQSALRVGQATNRERTQAIDDRRAKRVEMCNH